VYVSKALRYIIFISIFFIVPRIVFSYDSSGSVWLEPSNSAIYTDSTFDMHVKVDTGTHKLTHYQLKITYDPSVVKMDATQGENGVSVGQDGFLMITTLDKVNGSVTIMGSNRIGSGPSDNLDLLILHFKSLNKATSTFIGVSVRILKDEKGNILGNPDGSQIAISIKKRQTQKVYTSNKTQNTDTQPLTKNNDNNSLPKTTQAAAIEENTKKTQTEENKKTNKTSPTIDSFVSKPNSGIVPLSVTFSWNVHDDDNDTLTCYLDTNGDNKIDIRIDNCSNKHSATYTYKKPNNYKAVLIVEDSDKNSVSSSLNIEAKPIMHSITTKINNPEEGVIFIENGNKKCEDLCVYKYDNGTTISIKAKGYVNAIFNGWLGDCKTCKNDKQCKIVLDSDKLCVADFNTPPSIIDFSANPNPAYVSSDVKFNCKAKDKDGHVVKYTIDYGDGTKQTNSSGLFSHKYSSVNTYSAICSAEDDDRSSSSSNIDVKIIKKAEKQTESKIIEQTNNTKKETSKTYFTLDIQTSGKGNIETEPINKEGRYIKGTYVKLKAIPDNNSIFTKWEGDCAQCDNSSTCTITMDSDKECYANFETIEKNHKPKAVIIKQYKTVAVGYKVTLDGSASYDENNDKLSFSWELLSKPKNSKVQLSNPLSSKISFTPDIEGSYLVSLTVSDGEYSSQDNVTIEAIPIAKENRLNSKAIDNKTAIDISISQNSKGKLLNRIIIGKTDKDAVSGVRFPFGTVYFWAKTDNPGDFINVNISFDEPLPNHLTIYKVDNNKNYSEIPSDMWQRIDDYTISLTIQDGGIFDLDNKVNGYIEDPIAVGSVEERETTGGGGGGCSISNSNNDDIDPTFILLIILSIFGFAITRRKQKNI